jgi:HlyD family secretion protein
MIERLQMPRLTTLLIFLLLAACAAEEDAGPAYDTAAVERRTIEVAVSSAGIVEPLASVEVKSKASGEVLELRVTTGDMVDEGTLMVRIDPRTVRNRLDQSEAELTAALSRREIARTQKRRVESLRESGTLTQADLEQAVLDLANADAQVVASRVSVENARIALDDTDVRAPISGTVIVKPVEKGQVISSPTQDFAGGTLLMQMADLSEVQIRSLVDETDMAKVSVAAYPNQPFPGEVVKIEPQAVVEQNVTMFAVLVSIKNPDGLLMPGMNAEVEVSIARSEDVLTIPVMALRTNRDLETTASVLGRTEGAILAALSESSEPAPGDLDAPETIDLRGRTIELPAGSQQSGSPAKETSDYRFGGDFWVVLDNDQQEVRRIRTGVTDLDRVEVVRGLGEADRVLILPSSHLMETQQELQNFINRRVGRVPGISR